MRVRPSRTAALSGDPNKVPLLGPGTLYRLMRELRQGGWIERTTAPKGEEGARDVRRQYHGLTKLGRRVLVAESARLRRT